MLIRMSGVHHRYRYTKKEPGLGSSLRSLFSRSTVTQQALTKIDLSVEEGEMVGILGPNGAGKSTLLKILAGVLTPSEGAVRVGGHVPWERSPDYLSRISLVFGRKGQLEWELPPMDSFLLCRDIYGIPPAEFEARLQNLTKRLDVNDLLEKPVRQLSLGQRMKCELVAALLHEPGLLFLDEPTIGLDLVSQHQMRHFLKEYNRDTGCTVLLSTHHMKDIEDLCPRVVILDRGLIIYDGPFSRIRSQMQYRRVSVEFSEEVAGEDLVRLQQRLRDLEVTDLEVSPAGLAFRTSRDRMPRIGALLLGSDMEFDLQIQGPDADTAVRWFLTGKDGPP